ncbi:MAG TPA: dNTP triphosphohydrolase [Candidatus Anoxymicrobiaceae bacterium]
MSASQVPMGAIPHETDPGPGPLPSLATLEETLPKRVERARVHDDASCPNRGRFQLDRDRILYSGSFRKLQHKTQVFVTHEGDLYRTRMTHTIEVMQIARSIAGMLGLNEMLAEAIALVHDIGHPPFGHGGETTLNDLLKESSGFDHNIQGLRVVDHLERAYPGFRGLNLCWETREAMAKHYTVFDKPPLPAEFDLYSQPSAECQVVDVADTIAFCTHDLDDALRIRLARPEWLEQKAREIPLMAELASVMEQSVADPAVDLGASREDIGRMRAISNLINHLIIDVVDTTRRRIQDSGVLSAEEVRDSATPLVSFSVEAEEQVGRMARGMLDEVYNNPVVGRMIYKGGRILMGIHEAFIDKPDLLPRALKEDLATEPRERVVCDYLASMTDRYAMDLYAMLFQPYGRTTDWF